MAADESNARAVWRSQGVAARDTKADLSFGSRSGLMLESAAP